MLVIGPVERVAGRNVAIVPVSHGGGSVHSPEQIREAVEEVIK